MKNKRKRSISKIIFKIAMNFKRLLFNKIVSFKSIFAILQNNIKYSIRSNKSNFSPHKRKEESGN